MQENITGKVLDLFISIKGESERPSRDEIYVDADGIIGDKFYSKDDQRLILIASEQSYRLAKAKGIELEYGALGENIVIDIDPYNLKSGERLRIGDAVLEITQNCTLCNGLSKVNAKLPKLLKNDRGIFAKALNDARIKTGDTVYL